MAEVQRDICLVFLEVAAWRIYSQSVCHCYLAHELYSILINGTLCTVFVRHSLYVIP